MPNTASSFAHFPSSSLLPPTPPVTPPKQAVVRATHRNSPTSATPHSSRDSDYLHRQVVLQTMFYNSSTVPIGGAPFVPPSLALQDAVFYGDSSSSASSSRSSSISYPPSSSNSEANLGPAHSYGMSSSPSTSSSMQSDYSLSPRQIAAREYARRLHDHTASMWETERHNIEKTKLDSPGTPPRQKPRPTSGGGYIRPPAPPALAAAAVVEPPKERSRAMDVLLGKSWGKKWSGHARVKSL